MLEPYIQRDIANLTFQISKMVKAKNNAITDYIYSDPFKPTVYLDNRYRSLIKEKDLEKLGKLKKNVLIGREVTRTQENEVRDSIDSHI